MNTAIVFIQIGNPLPSYAAENIKRTSRAFNSETIFLIVDQEVLECIPFDVQSLRNLTIFVAASDQNIINIESKSREFRKGFWEYTKRRLCTLGELHRKYPEFSLLHIENDVLLFPDYLKFPFEVIRKTSWLVHTREADSGAVLFSPNLIETEKFVDRFLAEINMNGSLTDMRILKNLRISHPEQFGILPTLNSSPISAKMGAIVKNLETMEFGFDPAFLGIWMFGDDAQNRFGLSKRFTYLGSGKHLRPNIVTFDKANGRLMFGAGSKKVSVLSIHVHSKQTEVFGNHWNRKVAEVVEFASDGTHRYHFSPKILLEVLSDFKRRRKLHTLILILPIFGKLIKKVRAIVS